MRLLFAAMRSLSDVNANALAVRFDALAVLGCDVIALLDAMRSLLDALR